ncbi:MAG TPA: hypothetical protein PK536_04555 [Ignavibacteria bacterium]|nr:hypothetical protein [Bacteroidota bacterium]HRI84700.1 hypothetical protein [Ignavibacteria bacterium]HRJ99403.1 hypothetical protein [Ignavibacteria bacterium]
MLKSSLLEILRTFSKQELIKFEDFVRSPYNNKVKNVVNLFAEIKKYAPEFSDENLEKEKVWTRLFPGKKYNYGIMKNIIYVLTGLSEKFILLEEYSVNYLRCEIDLIEAAHSKNLPKFTSGKIDQLEKKINIEIDPNKYSSINQFLAVAYKFFDMKSSFIHEYNLKQDRQDFLSRSSDYLLFNFLVRSFKIIHNSSVNQAQVTRPVSSNFLEKFFLKLNEHSILEELFLNENKFQDKPGKIVYCFYLMYKALTSKGDKTEYVKFKTYLMENIDLFSAYELQNLNSCRNTCAIFLNSSDEEVAREALEWYKFLEQKNILLLKNGLIHNSIMLTVVNYSIKLKETQYAEEFLNRYKDKLPAESRDNTYNYCMAMIHFGKGEFGKSLECLSGISDVDMIQKYLIKKLYLRIYYEMNDYESFIYAFDTFAHFKKRNKITSEPRSQAFNDFVNSIRSLFKLRNKYDKYEAIKLRKAAGDQIWFLEKLDDLEKLNN